MHHERLLKRTGSGAKTLTVWKESLAKRHADLENLIDEETGHPYPDSLKIQGLKRRRLRVKEEMLHIEGILRTVGRPEPSAAA